MFDCVVLLSRYNISAKTHTRTSNETSCFNEQKLKSAAGSASKCDEWVLGSARSVLQARSSVCLWSQLKEASHSES